MTGGARRGRALAAALAVAVVAGGLWWYAADRSSGAGASPAADEAAAGATSTGGRDVPPEDGRRAGVGGRSAGASGDSAASRAGSVDGASGRERADRGGSGGASPADTARRPPSAEAAGGSASPDATAPGSDAPGSPRSEAAGSEPGNPPTAEEIVRRAAAAYDSLRSLRARFRQVLEMRVFEPTRRREGEGTWYQEKPAFLRMDFSDPEGDVIVSDGEHLWLYYPSTHPGQVIRTGLASPDRGTAVVDLQGRIFRQARTAYRPEYRGREEVTGRRAHLLELVPRRSDTQYRKVRVWVDERTYLLRRLEFHDRSETVRTITLDELEPNVPLPDSLFRFEPPPDAEVFEG